MSKQKKWLTTITKGISRYFMIIRYNLCATASKTGFQVVKMIAHSQKMISGGKTLLCLKRNPLPSVCRFLRQFQRSNRRGRSYVKICWNPVNAPPHPPFSTKILANQMFSYIRDFIEYTKVISFCAEKWGQGWLLKKYPVFYNPSQKVFSSVCGEPPERKEACWLWFSFPHTGPPSGIWEVDYTEIV